MSRDSIERDVAGVLRAHILLDSDREIASDAPLGPGVGLDSLALMEFLTALEEKFGVDFPDSLWTDRRDFTLDRLIDHLHDTGQESAGSVDSQPTDEPAPGVDGAP